jgi:hypothetical protein
VLVELLDALSGDRPPALPKTIGRLRLNGDNIVFDRAIPAAMRFTPSTCRSRALPS